MNSYTNEENNLLKKTGRITLNKIVIIGIMILGLQLPVFEIESLLMQRQKTGIDAAKSIFPESQNITEPVFILPSATSQGAMPIGQADSFAFDYVRFDTMTSNTTVNVNNLYRGIHQYREYEAEIHFQGSLDTKKLPAHLKSQDWQKADLVFFADNGGCGKTDCIKFKEVILTSKNGSYQVNPGKNSQSYQTIKPTAYSGPVKLPININDDEITISAKLIVKGGKRLGIHNTAYYSRIHFDSKFQSPGFYGNSIPTRKEVTSQGFSIDWSYDNQYQDNADNRYTTHWLIDENRNISGFSIADFIDDYRMVTRSLKYELLIFSLIFLAFITFEWMIKIPVHPIQYLMIGASICLFYLLLLSLMERIGFSFAYLISSSVITCLISGYSSAILKLWKRGGLIMGLLGTTFGYLYVLLSMEQNALLIGTVVLTVILTLIMYSTRDVDWYNLGQEA